MQSGHDGYAIYFDMDIIYLDWWWLYIMSENTVSDFTGKDIDKCSWGGLGEV